jgi:hypothetical protein
MNGDYMSTYKVGYGSYEESHYTELTHNNEYSEEELHNIVMEAIKNVLNNIVNNKYPEIYFDSEGPSYQDIDEYVIEELITNFGFSKVTYKATWSIFGWPSLTNLESWSNQRGETLNRVFHELPENLITNINLKGQELHNKEFNND